MPIVRVWSEVFCSDQFSTSLFKCADWYGQSSQELIILTQILLNF